MIDLLHKYSEKISNAGLCQEGQPLLAGLDDELVFNRQSEDQEILRPIFDRLSINSLLLAPLAEPYATMVNHLAQGRSSIRPEDRSYPISPQA